MTTTATDTLALDAWLAEHLFGWRYFDEGRWFIPPDRVADLLGGTLRQNPPTMPAYSTTGDGMLLVLEALKARGYHFTLVTQNKCMISREGRRGGWDAYGDTLPLAVASAARAALEGEAAR